MKDLTLLYLYKPKEEQILLAMKKRGFGEGKWNGVGGKIEAGETIEAAAVREAKEEAGVLVQPEDLKKVAVMEFSFDGKPEVRLRVHTFLTERWSGEPTESDEMRPLWHGTKILPYQKMWVSDQYWLPRVLMGERLEAAFTFTASGEEILAMKVEPAPS